MTTQAPQQQDTAPLPRVSGRDLRLIRKARDLRQADVARRIGVSLTKLSFLENGIDPITPELEVKIVRALWP